LFDIALRKSVNAQGGLTEKTYKLAQGSVGPQDTLGGDSLAGLPHVHAEQRAEEILDLVAVVVPRQPARAAERQAAHGEGGELDEGEGVEMGREQPGDVVVVSDEQDAGDGMLELGQSGLELGSAREAAVDEGAGSVASTPGGVLDGVGLALLALSEEAGDRAPPDMGVLGRHGCWRKSAESNSQRGNLHVFCYIRRDGGRAGNELPVVRNGGELRVLDGPCGVLADTQRREGHAPAMWTTWGTTCTGPMCLRSATPPQATACASLPTRTMATPVMGEKYLTADVRQKRAWAQR